MNPEHPNYMEAARVDGTVITLGHILRLAYAEQTMPALQDHIRHTMILQYAHQQDIELTQQDLQEEIDRFRKERQLFTSAETMRWLEEGGMMLNDLADIVKPRCYKRKLLRSFPAQQVEAYFTEHRTSFDRVHLSHIVLKEYGQARELRFRLEEGANFHALAREYTLDEATRYGGGYLGLRWRMELQPAVAAAVFGGRDGEVVGPIETKAGMLLVRIEKLLPARLDAETEADIRQRLFDAWLNEREAAANIRTLLWEAGSTMRQEG